MHESPPLELVSTNIEGLDNVLFGGFQRQGYYLIQGAPGSGKTTLAMQYMNGRARAGERCLYVTLTESRRDLELICRAHGWSLETIELRDLTRTLDEPQQSSVFDPADTELSEILKLVR